MKKIFTSLSILILISGCALTKYKQPEDGQPYALIKLKYSFHEVLFNTEVGARLGIRPAEKKNGFFKKAHEKSYGYVNKKHAPEIPLEAIKVHPNEKLSMKMAVYFYWYTTQTYTTYVNGIAQTNTTQQYNERNCNAFMSFTPESGKIYLIDYTQIAVDDQCNAIVYEQKKLANGKFEMKLVTKSEPLKKKEESTEED